VHEILPGQCLNPVRLIKVLLALSLRPERMTEASLICLKKDFDLALGALDDFGNFHIEEMKEDSKVTRYEQFIRQNDETVRNLNTIISQLKIEKTGFLDSFKAESITKIEINAENWQQLLNNVEKETSKLKKNVNAHRTSLNNIEEELASLQHFQNVLTILNRFKIDLEALEEMHLIFVAIVTVSSKNIPELGIALSNYPCIFHHRSITKGQEFIFVATSIKHKEEIEKILNNHHAESFQLPEELHEKPSEALKKISIRTDELVQNKKVVLESLENLAWENKQRLFALRETAQNISSILNGKQKSLETKRLVTVKGYIPKKEIEKLERKMDDNLDQALLLEKSPINTHDPPTKIHNHSFIKPFETITKLYGVPHYDEIDPTPLIAITFPLIFGLMFGDAGHGLTLLIAGIMLGTLIKRDEGIRNFSWILAACGIGAIIAGLLFGEFFGKQIFAPLWFSPFKDVIGFLTFSLFVGVIQITSGFVLELVNFILKGEIVDAFATSLPKILFYVGSIYLILMYQLNFNLWLQGPILLPLIPFIFLIFGKSIIVKSLKALGHPLKNSNGEESLLERVFESGDLVTRVLSNTMSYARILALLMAHWALILVTYTISGMVFNTPTVGAVLGIIIIVGGNIFVLAFEGLIVFIHTLRLHFYEWFSKFYRGTGVAFSPFKQSYKYTKIIFKR
jgi:V/A-type H+-transporting ATPase subunit I